MVNNNYRILKGCVLFNVERLLEWICISLLGDGCDLRNTVVWKFLSHWIEHIGTFGQYSFLLNRIPDERILLIISSLTRGLMLANMQRLENRIWHQKQRATAGKQKDEMFVFTWQITGKHFKILKQTNKKTSTSADKSADVSGTSLF